MKRFRIQTPAEREELRLISQLQWMNCYPQVVRRLTEGESANSVARWASGLGQERLPMRKIKEVLRLQSLGLSQRQIAASCAVGQATVSDYLKTAEAAGLRWPDIAEWSEDQVMQAVAPLGDVW